MNNTKYKQAELLLYSMLGNQELVQTWWNTPNKGFDGKLPSDVWSENPDTVMSYLYMHADGGW